MRLYSLIRVSFLIYIKEKTSTSASRTWSPGAAVPARRKVLSCSEDVNMLVKSFLNVGGQAVLGTCLQVCPARRRRFVSK